MRLGVLAACAAALSSGPVCSASHAAVTQSSFPPKTTADLVALCSAQKSDPLYAAAVNYCQGFFEGAVEVALSYSAVGPQSHRPFCLPSPPPTLDQATSDFASWANGDAARLDRPALIGLIGYLIERYPCPREATAQRGNHR